MLDHVFQSLKAKTSAWTFNSMFYDWSLRGDVPERLVVKPVDTWPGDAAAGQRLCEGVFCLGDEELALRGPCWEPFGVDEAWIEHMHGFSWLRDMPAYAYQSGQQARVRAHTRAMILAWIDRYKSWKALPWRADITGERIAMWIALYEFFGPDALMGDDDVEFHDLFFESLVRQGRHLSRLIYGDSAESLNGVGAFQAAKGLLYAGLAFEGYEVWAEIALDVIENEIDKQILGDGAHISRSPQQLLKVLRILLDVRGAMRTAGYPLPESVQHAIDKMGPALRFFRCSDKGFGVFNGAQEGDITMIDAALAQADVRGKVMNSLPCAGYERISLGRMHVMFDCGKPPVKPYDKLAHAAPLSFEMSYGRDRVFVNCGTHPYDAAWIDALRASAAHNTLSLDYRNIYEIRDDKSFARKASHVMLKREDMSEACLLDAEHNGYYALNGLKHRRRLYLCDDGEDLIGEDTLSASAKPHKALEAAVRFHLHPKVNVSLIREGQEALLRLPNGMGWRFKYGVENGPGMLALENSIYLGSGAKARNTKQLVIYSQITEKISKIKWRLNKEG